MVLCGLAEGCDEYRVLGVEVLVDGIDACLGVRGVIIGLRFCDVEGCWFV